MSHFEETFSDSDSEELFGESDEEKEYTGLRFQLPDEMEWLLTAVAL